ncbi:MAG: hypothetical protein AAF675_06505 [Pseudomonadota bacterium]
MTSIAEHFGRAREAIEARPALVRWILGGPVTVILALLATAAMPIWLPEGAAGIDHLVIPIVLFPATWALIFFYAVMETRPFRMVVVFVAGTIVNLAFVAQALVGGGS